MSEFPKKYSPSSFENDLYKNWEETGKFKPRKSTTWEQFYIPIPPPNVTGVLHLGHALTSTIQDIMIRYHRMKGDETLWIPGTDHAGISTQAKVEQKLAAEGKSKHDLSREDFLKECWSWKETHASIITDQFKKMWSSCDWSRERFTLDDGLHKRVNKAFVDLYRKGLIYKGEYMVNYSPALQTVLSDQEVIYKEKKGKMYYITYFVAGSDNEVIIATTRPETLLWDVAVAVHPKDKRYKKLLKGGKSLVLPIVNKEIPIIADEMVDMELWTGAVKITPAHDANDFEVARRHNLPLDNVVISKDGKMTEKTGIFEGQDYMIARNNVVELLKAKGNLIKIEDHVSKVGYCERSWAKVETIISTQWFVSVDWLAKKVIKWYKGKEFEIIPKKFNKTFEDWIFNLRDWCISRQLLWGHQIPVWYGPDEEVFCAESEQEAQLLANTHYGKSVELIRETDVLDTWFSSGLWPFSILDFDMWGGKQPEDFNKFYPASVLETGHDIIFFWVIRMLLFWYEFTDQAPFKKIYLHGMVKDRHGTKMSKSKWNGIDPLDMIKKYGTDALRLTLTIWNTPWNDLKFDEKNVENNMLFVNKLWNASRFVSTHLSEKINKISLDLIEKDLIDNYDDLMFHEKWILSRMRYLWDLVTWAMEDYNFSEAGSELQIFTKNEFCDHYIEEYKLTKETSKHGQKVICYVLNNLLKLWHPYIPFVTEEIYNKVWFEWELIISTWPNIKIKRDEQLEKDKKLIIEIIREIRSLRADNNIMPNKTIGLQIYAKNKNAELISEVIDLIAGIVKADQYILVDKKPSDDNLAYWVIKAWVEVFIDTSNALDVEKETDRIKDQITDTKEYIALLDKKLLNEAFISRAPERLIRIEMEKKEQAKQKLEKLEAKIIKLN